MFGARPGCATCARNWTRRLGADNGWHEPLEDTDDTRSETILARLLALNLERASTDDNRDKPDSEVPRYAADTALVSG